MNKIDVDVLQSLGKVIFRGAWEPKQLRDFFQIYSAPSVMPYEQYVNFIHFGPVKNHVILFADPVSAKFFVLCPGKFLVLQNDSTYEYVLSELTKAAEGYRGKYLFILMTAPNSGLVSVPNNAASPYMGLCAVCSSSSV